ncbi:hypothetical protein C4552_02995 [Candidatus Parcubacteria bacterium]|nr:MAG: hypothetical protein C4552_02995 [Candidatus Parcubacteria bacterium]
MATIMNRLAAPFGLEQFLTEIVTPRTALRHIEWRGDVVLIEVFRDARPEDRQTFVESRAPGRPLVHTHRRYWVNYSGSPLKDRLKERDRGQGIPIR